MSAALTASDKIQGVLQKQGSTLADVVKAATAPVIYEQIETPKPKSPALTPAVAQAISELPGVLGSLELPVDRGQLTDAEKEQVIYALDLLKEVTGGVAKSEKEIKVGVHRHFDAVARDAGRVTELTPRTKDGFAVLEDKASLAVADLDKKITREVQAGGVALGAEQLAAMEADNVITHKQYLRMTRAVRVVDEGAVMSELSDDPALALRMAEYAQISDPIAKINLRPNK